MIHAHDLSIDLGGRSVLDAVAFTVPAGRMLGVVGPNGSGKTTLLRILSGELVADRGSMSLDGASVAYVPQVPPASGTTTVGALYPELFDGDVLEAALTVAGQRLADASDSEAVVAAAEYDRLLARLERAAAPAVITEARTALGVPPVPAKSAIGELSGGELAKLSLLHLVAVQPEVLLLDEPTNHLDLAGVTWLNDYLEAFEGPAVVVSHDRALLDDQAGQLLVLGASGAPAEVFTGGYSAWLEELDRRRTRAQTEFDRQQREERKMRRAIQAAEGRARGIEQRTIDFHYRKRALKVARRVVTMKARLEREHDRGERVERPPKIVEGLQGEFQEADRSATRLIEVDRLAVEMDGRSLFQDASFTVERGDRTVVVGANGSGKTSLLRVLSGEVAASAGHVERAASAKVGWLPQDDRALLPADQTLTAIEYLRLGVEMTEEEAYDHLHRFLFGHDAARGLVVTLSPGELRRLALARLVLTGANLLLLDEPTNHLDLPAREAFEATLHRFDGATVVATHDRYFIEQHATGVITIAAGRVTHS